MFGDWISLGLLGSAYGLDDKKSIELAQSLTYQDKHNLLLGFDIQKIDDIAREHAYLFEEQGDEYIRGIFAQKWRLTEQWRPDARRGDNSYLAYVSSLEGGGKEEARDILQTGIRGYLFAHLEVDKKRAVLTLEWAGHWLQAEVPGLTRAFVAKVLAEHAKTTTPPPQPSPQGHPPTSSAQKPADPFALAAWKTAVDTYEKDHMTRSNDALPARMRVFLRSLEGVPFSDLEKEFPGRTICRDLGAARSRDVPHLEALFPHLVTLNF